MRTYRLTLADLVAHGADHDTSQDLWDGDDLEYALLKADWERQEAAGRESFADNTRPAE